MDCQGGWRGGAGRVLPLTLLGAASLLSAAETGRTPIRDNSFLVEEAYNQE
jgi:hypothetical protein